MVLLKIDLGIQVAIGRNKIVVGAPFAKVSTGNAGAVYVYNLDGTGEVKITASDPESTAYFGLEVAIGDNKIVVGAPGDATDTGAVYVYDLDGTNETKITASNSGLFLDEFGGAVAVGNGKIVDARLLSLRILVIQILVLHMFII